MGIGLGVVDLDVADLPLVVEDRKEPGIDEALVGSEVQLGIAREDLLMELGVNGHGVSLDQVAGFRIVALTLNALNLSE